MFLTKILTEPQVHLYSFSFFSGGFNSSFWCWSYPFLVSEVLSYWCSSYSFISRYSIIPECLRYLSPWRKRVGRWENKGNLGRMKQTPLRRTDNWSCGCWRDRIHLKRDTPVEQDWHDNLDYHEGLVFTLEYENTGSERYGINTWLWSNSNTTTQNKTKDWLAE